MEVKLLFLTPLGAFSFKNNFVETTSSDMGPNFEKIKHIDRDPVLFIRIHFFYRVCAVHELNFDSIALWWDFDVLPYKCLTQFQNLSKNWSTTWWAQYCFLSHLGYNSLKTIVFSLNKQLTTRLKCSSQKYRIILFKYFSFKYIVRLFGFIMFNQCSVACSAIISSLFCM